MFQTALSAAGYIIPAAASAVGQVTALGRAIDVVPKSITNLIPQRLRPDKEHASSGAVRAVLQAMGLTVPKSAATYVITNRNVGKVAELWKEVSKRRTLIGWVVALVSFLYTALKVIRSMGGDPLARLTLMATTVTTQACERLGCDKGLVELHRETEAKRLRLVRHQRVREQWRSLRNGQQYENLLGTVVDRILGRNANAQDPADEIRCIVCRGYMFDTHTDTMVNPEAPRPGLGDIHTQNNASRVNRPVEEAGNDDDDPNPVVRNRRLRYVDPVRNPIPVSYCPHRGHAYRREPLRFAADGLCQLLAQFPVHQTRDTFDNRRSIHYCLSNIFSQRTLVNADVAHATHLCETVYWELDAYLPMIGGPTTSQAPSTY